MFASVSSALGASLQRVPLWPAPVRGSGGPAPAQDAGEADQADPAQPGRPAAQEAETTPAQQRELARLEARDREVRAHEQAHLATGGGLITSGPSFTYELGPDKRHYAVAGEVHIDTSPGRSPQHTITKAQQIRAAALAPAQPSGADRQVAAQASQMEMQARIARALVQHYEAVGQHGGPGEHRSTAPRLQASA